MLEVTGGASITGKSKAASVDFAEYYKVCASPSPKKRLSGQGTYDMPSPQKRLQIEITCIFVTHPLMTLGL